MWGSFLFRADSCVLIGVNEKCHVTRFGGCQEKNHVELFGGGGFNMTFFL